MAESRKMKTEKGLALVPGANPLADGCNFAVEVPEDSRASPILYRKRSAKPYVEIPFTEENRTGNVYAMYIPDFNLKEYEYSFLIMERCILIPVRTGFWDGNALVQRWVRIRTKSGEDFLKKKFLTGRTTKIRLLHITK